MRGKTKIFLTYEKFLERPDKSVNGVSPEFTKSNPNYKKENETNEGCWNCFNCSRCFRCSNCFDCSNCFNCFNCSNCFDCSRCSRCFDCSNCSDCSNCFDCSNCSDCSDCSNCSDCYACSRCSRCSNCYACSDYVDNPQRYLTGRIGSRNDQTIFFWLGDKVTVVCGCFVGDLEEFEIKVRETHFSESELVSLSNPTPYFKQYMDEIQKFKVLKG